MNELIKINETNITTKEYHGQRVVTFKDIDACHSRSEGTAKRNFAENKQHLVSKIDYFEIDREDVGTKFVQTYGFSKKAPKGIIITESGYLMLCKSLTDDLAWDVQRQLVNKYFRKDTVDESLKLQIQQERAHAMSMNAKTRALKMISQSIGDKKLSALAIQVFGLTAIEEVTGQKIDYRPECGKLYSAQDLANEVGSNRNMIGRKAKAAGLKTDEFGMTVLSKSEHSEKQVDTFMYNEKGRSKVKELFGKEDSNKNV